MDRKLLRQLGQIDWDFITGDETGSGGLHWYPGSFVPGLPAALIEALSDEGDFVFDPYAGSGTTGIAGMVRGRKVICTDFHPIAAASAYVALGILSIKSHDQTAFDALFEAAASLIFAEKERQPSLLREPAEVRSLDKIVAGHSTTSIRDAKLWITKRSANRGALQRWYGRHTLAELVAVQNRMSEFDRSEFVQLFCGVMLSAVSRSLCSQTSSWGHIADNVYPKSLVEKDVARSAHLWLRRTYARFNALERLENAAFGRPCYTVRCVDWTSGPVPRFPKSRLLVTSPPYAGAIDYILAQRLSFYLMGWSDDELMSLSARELGARRKRFRDSHRDLWATELVQAAERQLKFVTKDAVTAFVLPHKESGRDNGAERLLSFMVEHGWRVAFQRDRSIRQARTRQSWTSIKRETILVFDRAG